MSKFAISHGRGEIAEQLGAEDGFYQTFVASNWEYRDRLIPVRGSSPEVIYDIANLGIQPDLVYLDADKSGREIEICHKLFPAAVITGDDWWWGMDRRWRVDEGYPIRKPVKAFSKENDVFLKTSGHTWVLDDQPPTLSYQLTRPSYHLKSARRRLRGFLYMCTGYKPRGGRAA